METRRTAASGMKSLRWIGCVSLILLSWAQCEGSVVTVALHGTAVLPCSVSFISGTEYLTVIWVKRPQGPNDKQFLVLHRFNKGRYNLIHQAPQYTGRTSMSTDLSTGRLDLTLTHVERRDEGVYICQVTDNAGYGDVEVRLSVIIPVSVPVLNVSCGLNSSAEISCWVQDGTDPEYSLSVNGRLELEDSGSSLSGVNITASSATPWNITCSVRNRISERNSSRFYESCAAHGTHGGVVGRTWLLVSLCIGLLGLSGCAALYLYTDTTFQTCRQRKKMQDTELEMVGLKGGGGVGVKDEKLKDCACQPEKSFIV